MAADVIILFLCMLFLHRFCLLRLARVRCGALRTAAVRRSHRPKHLCPVDSAGRDLSTRPSAAVFRVSEEVQDALATGKPVVALETAIVTHGMPEPHNVDVAHMVEGRVRAEGSVPATVGLLDGKVVVGLTAQELKLLAAASRERRARKVSRRDLAVAIAEKAAGGTTVSATMMAAHWAGIHVFVTGGIGGVHRDGENSLDVSADLTELGRTPVAVVCAGCKSILDIGRTLEYLETQGVPTITFGEQKNFPAFFAPDSGFAASTHLSTVSACGRVINSSLELGLESGLVIGVPIPSEEGKAVDAAIHQALQEAKAADVAGRDVTPFVLQRVNELSSGKSLAANIELIKNNATIGSQIAREVSQLRSSNGGGGHPSTPSPRSLGTTPTPPNAHVHQFSPPSSHISPPSDTSGRMTFGSLPPSSPFPGFVDGASGEGGHVTQGNSPPLEYVNATTQGTASSIDADIAAEFENLVPREYRAEQRHPPPAPGFTPPHQTTRRYHATAAARRAPPSAESPGAEEEEDAQRKLDREFLRRRDADFQRSVDARCPVVIGAAVVDVVAKPTDADIQLRLTNNCSVSTSFGGVGRNIFEAMSRCGQPPLFISSVGSDESQSSVLSHIDSFLGQSKWCSVGVRPCHQQSTATYMAVLQRDGELFTGIGNFDVVQRISPSWLRRFEKHLQSAPIVVLDGNLTGEAIGCVLSACQQSQTPVWFEPTCTVKAAKVYSALSTGATAGAVAAVSGSVTIASPNLAELQTMARVYTDATGGGVGEQLRSALAHDVSSLMSAEVKASLCRELCDALSPVHPCLLVTLGEHGVMMARWRLAGHLGDDDVSLKQCLQAYAQQQHTDMSHATSRGDGSSTMDYALYNLPTPVDVDSIVSVSGAGDSFVGAVVASMLSDGGDRLSVSECMRLGLRAARTSLAVSEAINPALSLDTVL